MNDWLGSDASDWLSFNTAFELALSRDRRRFSPFDLCRSQSAHQPGRDFLTLGCSFLLLHVELGFSRSTTW